MAKVVEIRRRGASAAQRYRPPPAKRGRPPLRDADQRILLAAAELFGQKEFHHVSTEEVAERAGTGKGTVYRRFPSKEVLYVAASIHGLTQLRSELEKVLRTAPSSRIAIEVIVRRLLLYFWDKREFFLLLRNFAGLSGAYRRRYEAERRKLSVMIRSALALGAEDAAFGGELEVQIAAEALLGMVRAVSRLRADSVPLSNVSDRLVVLFLEGWRGLAGAYVSNGERKVR